MGRPQAQIRGLADRDRVAEDDVRLIQQVSTATSLSNTDFIRPAQARKPSGRFPITGPAFLIMVQQ